MPAYISLFLNLLSDNALLAEELALERLAVAELTHELGAVVRKELGAVLLHSVCPLCVNMGCE